MLGLSNGDLLSGSGQFASRAEPVVRHSEQVPYISGSIYPEIPAGDVVGSHVTVFAADPFEDSRGGPIKPLAGTRFESGPQEPSQLDLALPTYVDHDVVVAASVGPMSEEQAISVLRQAGAPEEWIPDMLVIAWCESKYTPQVKGDSGNSLGWFQLWSGWFQAGEDPFDALTNARVAVRVRETRGRFGGAGGWSCAGLNGIP